VLKVDYQKQISGLKIMGVWAKEACKSLGILIYFCNVEVKNFKFGNKIGLGE